MHVNKYLDGICTTDVKKYNRHAQVRKSACSNRSTYTYMYVCLICMYVYYTYVQRESPEREREIHIYIYVYMYICIYAPTSTHRPLRPEPGLGLPRQ